MMTEPQLIATIDARVKDLVLEASLNDNHETFPDNKISRVICRDSEKEKGDKLLREMIEKENFVRNCQIVVLSLSIIALASALIIIS